MRIKKDTSIKNIIYSLIIILFVINLFPRIASAQCEDDEFLDHCFELLGDYTYIKTYESEAKEGSSKYPHTNAYIFSKGTRYVITACGKNSEGDKMIINLYNRNRRLVASSFNKRGERNYSKIIYNCSATGIYYIQPIIDKKDGRCGISILGFKKI